MYDELRIGCGYAGGADRSIDLWVIEAAATKGCPATSYEIKVSRSDFQKDMKQPAKNVPSNTWTAMTLSYGIATRRSPILNEQVRYSLL
jgi:hypothetical protein